MTLESIEQVKFDSGGLRLVLPTVEGTLGTIYPWCNGSTMVSKTISQSSNL